MRRTDNGKYQPINVELFECRKCKYENVDMRGSWLQIVQSLYVIEFVYLNERTTIGERARESPQAHRIFAMN